MNVSIPDGIESLLRKKVEEGYFPSEEAVIEEALRRFLGLEPGSSTTWSTGRLPGPFLEDEMASDPVDLPRPGPSVPRPCTWDAARHPDSAQGE